MEKFILELNRVETSLLYKCVSFALRIEEQRGNPGVPEEEYDIFLDELNSLYQKVVDLDLDANYPYHNQ